LDYIETDKTLRHKGRVAFEISNHEVMITELLINNILTDLHPAEIISILSLFVFEQVGVKFTFFIARLRILFTREPFCSPLGEFCSLNNFFIAR